MPSMKYNVNSGSFYGITGNGETCCLISPGGSIDWMCAPRFDSGFVFGRLIDTTSGYFTVAPIDTPRDSLRYSQTYLQDTAILNTVCTDIVGAPLYKITDFMPWGSRELRRLITPAASPLPIVAEIFPTFDYRRAPHSWEESSVKKGRAAWTVFSAISATQSITVKILSSSLRKSLLLDRPGGLKSLALELTCDKPVEIIVTYGEMPDLTAPSVSFDKSLAATRTFWHDWLSKSPYNGRYIEYFRRSLITMKLLTYAPTGAILAAGTTSIPQNPGSGSNWDYRFTWVRDGSYAAASYLAAGYVEEATAFIDFVFSLIDRTPGAKPWQPLYRIDGDPDCTESILGHLDGFLGDGPIRIGNLAYQQNQHDLEGEALETLWDIYMSTGDQSILARHWDDIILIADFVTANWRKPDNGIWELRGVITHYTHSKAMCWTALNRAYLAAAALGKRVHAARYGKEANRIKADILANGWNETMDSFAFAYDAPLIDSCLIALPLTGFLAPSHPKIRSMISRIEKHLVAQTTCSRNIIEPAPFLLTTYWLARYYAAAGETLKARHIIDGSIALTTDLGLFCEQALGGGEIVQPSLQSKLQTLHDMLAAHKSPKSFTAMIEMLYNFQSNTSTYKNDTKTPEFTPELARMFRGNFPQVYSHEELVRAVITLGE